MPTRIRIGVGIQNHRFRPVGASFNAADLPNCKLWLKAGDIAQSNGTAVASWADASGLGNNAAQSVALNKPTYRTTGVGGNPAVEFDGIAGFMSGTLVLSGTTNLTVFMVMRYLAQGGGGSMSFYRSGETDSNDQDLSIVNYNENSAKSTFYKYNPGGSITNPVNGTDMIYACEMGVAAGKSQAWLNGSPSAQVVTDTTNWNVTNYIIGARATPLASSFMNVRIAEVIICLAALDTAARNSVWSAMGAKYGITVTLE